MTMLVKAGGDVNASILDPQRSNRRFTLLDLAIKAKDSFAEAMLRDNGAKTSKELSRLQSKQSRSRKE